MASKSPTGTNMRPAFPVVLLLLLLKPFLLKASELPVDFFPGILLDQPLPTTFETGQTLSLSGKREDSDIIRVHFSFSRVDGFQQEFPGYVNQGRFVREAVFPHSASGQYNLVVEANRGLGNARILGRFEGLQIDRGQGPVNLPRRYFPYLNLDRPLPTSIATGEALHIAGNLDQEYGPSGGIIFRFLSETGAHWDFYFLARGDRFERTIILPPEAEGANAVRMFLFKRWVSTAQEMARYPHLDIRRGTEPSEIPRLFFNGLVLDEPLPVQWPVGEPVVVAGTAYPFVRELQLRLTPVNGKGRRVFWLDLKEGRFNFPATLTTQIPRPVGPLRLIFRIELEDGVVWDAGAYVIEAIDPLAADLEVGVLSVALLAGKEATIPLFNRGNGTVQLEKPLIEGPFAVERYPLALEPGEAGEIVLSYRGAGGDQGLLAVLSDDPFRPRVSIALSGLERREAASDLVHLRADSEGRLEADLDLREQDFVLALYSAPLDGTDGARYEIVVDGNAVRTEPAPAPLPDPIDSLGHPDRQQEHTLALRLQQRGRQAGKPVRVRYEVGDRRSFFFRSREMIQDQSIEARVVAVNERAVAFAQEDLREDENTVTEEEMQTVIDQFAEDYPILVEAFGAPSDVDGDGKIAVVFTHLIDDLGLTGSFYAASVVPPAAGGDGNMTDLLWLNTALPVEYRPLLAHLFQHLINYNQHVLVRRSSPEAGWLSEGLSHVAADLVTEKENSNYGHVRNFLRRPGSSGFNTATVFPAWDGAVYLFVRSLVDLLGKDVLLRLVQTDLVGVANVEAATGERMSDLMARWGAQLYISGTGQSGHPRFNYGLATLQTPEGRGFPQPASVIYRLGEDPPALSIQAWGLQFLRVAGNGTARISLQTERKARLGAVVLPVAKSRAAAPMAADHFPGITLDPPLPLELATGEPLLVQGTTADSVQVIDLEFVPEGGGEGESFFLLVDEGRFSRAIFFQHDEAATYTLNVHVANRKPSPFAGSFYPIRISRGHGPLQAPTGYFNRVRLDRPLPTSVYADQPLEVSGEVTDPEANLMEFVFYPLDEDGNTGAAVDTQSLSVDAGRFDGKLLISEIPTGSYRLAVSVGSPGDLTYVGAVISFEILLSTDTVVESGAEPAVFALYPNYPNPFNRGTVLSFSLPEAQASVELAVYDLLGQKLAVLVRGVRGPGFHSVEWNGLDDSGRALASGSYLYRLRAGPHRAVGKLMLLR